MNHRNLPPTVDKEKVERCSFNSECCLVLSKLSKVNLVDTITCSA